MAPQAPTASAPSRAALAALAALIAAYAAVYGFLTVVKFRYYLYTDFDLAIFTQATDQALRGSLFSSIRGMNWLGDHVSLILFLLAPLYALVRHPVTLLMLQTVTLALGAWPVFALARRELKQDGLALACAALYLLYPAVGYTNLFEFHPEVLATTTLLATIHFLALGRFVPTLLFAALSLLCKEDAALVVGMLGLTALLRDQTRRLGLALVAQAAVSLVASFGLILPALGSTAADYGKMYAEWGNGVGEIAVNLLSHPLRALAAFVNTPDNPIDTALKRLYWLHMTAPLLFLPVLSPVSLVVALPVLAEHFLSFRQAQHWIQYQYTALVTPVMVAAAVRGYARLLGWLAGSAITAEAMARPGRARSAGLWVAGLALAASLVCNLRYGPVLGPSMGSGPMGRESHWPKGVDRALRVYRDRMSARVPRTGAVVTGFEFLARQASRREVHSIHHVMSGYYTFSSSAYPTPTDVVAMLADVADPHLARYVDPNTPQRLRDLASENHLRPEDAAGDLLLLSRAPTDTVELVTVGVPPAPIARQVVYDGQLALVGFALRDSTVAPGGLLPLDTYWRRVAPVDRMHVIQFVLLDKEGAAAFWIGRPLGYLLYPPSTWPADTTVREAYRMVIPAGLPPGDYTLALRVAWRLGGPATPSEPDDPEVRQRMRVDLGRFRIVAADRR